MYTESERLNRDDGDQGDTYRHTVRFTDLGSAPNVTLVFDRYTFDGGVVESGVERIVVEGSMLTAADVERVSEALPRLVALAYGAVSPDVPSLVQTDMVDLAAGAADRGIQAEVARAAAIYRQAVEDDRLPLQAVMKALNLSKPTASRRVRAAKDLGLIPDNRGGK